MATGILRTFRPLAATQNAAPGLAAATLTLTGRVGSQAARIYNKGTSVVYIDFTTGANTAAVATSMPLAAGAVEVFTLQQDVTTISHIADAAGNTLYVTLGEGL